LTEPKDRSDEASLIIAYKRNGDFSILGELYKPYMNLIYGLCLKYLKNKVQAQDAVIDIFEELIEKLAKFEVENFKSWLYVLSKNHCLMILRSQKKAKHESFSENHLTFMENEAAKHPFSEDKLANEEKLDALTTCIEKLKKEQKECVQLFYLQQKSYKEIELITKLALKKIKSLIQNGKRNLKICMQESE